MAYRRSLRRRSSSIIPALMPTQPTVDEGVMAYRALRALIENGDEHAQISVSREHLPPSLVTLMAHTVGGNALACIVTDQRLDPTDQRIVLDRLVQDPRMNQAAASALAERRDLSPWVAEQLWYAAEATIGNRLDADAVRCALATNEATPMSLLVTIAVSHRCPRAGEVELGAKLAARRAEEWASLSSTEFGALLASTNAEVRTAALCHGVPARATAVNPATPVQSSTRRV
jgi:hypothetical protein